VKLYQARESFRPKDQLDIGVNAGDLVGVVQQKDPMGNRNRWFVDNGLTQGFVPSRVLAAIGENNHAPTREAEVIVATAAAGIAPEATARHQYDDVASEEVCERRRQCQSQLPAPLLPATATKSRRRNLRFLQQLLNRGMRRFPLLRRKVKAATGMQL
jgi:hypothetical protein